MKKVILAALAGVMLLACNNVAKYQEPINALSEQWNTATTSVADFATLLGQEIANAQQITTGMQIGEEAIAKLDDAKKMEYEGIVASFTAENQVLSALNEEVNTFVAAWGEKAQKLEGLKAGLESGKMGEDADAVITELQTAAADASTQVAAWTEKMNSAKMKISEAAKQQGTLFSATSSSLTGK